MLKFRTHTLRLVRNAVLVAALLALPAAGAASTAATSDATNTVANPSFEADLTSWGAYRATLARVAGGSDGAWSVSVTAVNPGTWSISQYAVSAAVAGTTYRATGSVRVRSASRTVCLVVREWAGATIVGSSSQCVRPSSAWSALPAVTYSAGRSGSSIELYATSTKGKRGNAFDVDALALTPTTAAVPSPGLAVSMTPSAAEVAGTVTLAAAVTSGTAARVEFLANGQLIASDTTAAYSTPWDTTTVADGSISLTARAVSGSGETATSAAQSVTVDNTAPDATITSGPSGTVTSNAASFSFAATGAATFQCSLNGSAWASCSSPTAYSGLSNATHTFNVRAADGMGNVDQTPASRSWTVNVATTTPPPPPPPSTVTCDRVAATNGSDANAGTLSAPYLTPQKLADSLASGQTGCLRGGSYSSSATYVLNVTRSGFRIRSYPAERARLVGIVQVKNTASGVTLSHLDFEGTGTQNTIQVYAADIVIEDNKITNLSRGRSCMMLGDNAGSGAAVRSIVRRNRFHDCGSAANDNKDHGIYTGNLVDGQILNNVFWNTAAYAIHLYPNAQRTRVAYNVIDGGLPSVRGGIIVAGDTSYTSRDNVIELNVIAFSQTANIETWWGGTVGTGNVARKNCVWAGKQANITGNGLTATENLVTDPLFVNRASRDYRLSATGACRTLIGIDPAAALT